ncbi:hypothetical protein, partial [Salmonella enterica]
TVEAAERFLAAPINGFDDARAELHNHTINTFEPLLGRIDPKHVEAMVEASKDSLAPAEAKPAPKKAREEKAKPMTEATA